MPSASSPHTLTVSRFAECSIARLLASCCRNTSVPITIRREYLDRVFFWNAVDLARKLGEFRDYYNEHRVHSSLGGTTPAQRAGASSPAPASLDHHAWREHCQGLFQTLIAA
jgi:hypothetical protein